MENRIQHLGCSNGFNEEQNRIFDELYNRWKSEKEQGKEVKYFETNLGRCYNRYTYIFADGSGFCFEVDSSD